MYLVTAIPNIEDHQDIQDQVQWVAIGPIYTAMIHYTDVYIYRNANSDSEHVMEMTHEAEFDMWEFTSDAEEFEEITGCRFSTVMVVPIKEVESINPDLVIRLED